MNKKSQVMNFTPNATAILGKLKEISLTVDAIAQLVEEDRTSMAAKIEKLAQKAQTDIRGIVFDLRRPR